MYRIQSRDHNGKWKNMQRVGTFATEALAWARVASCDQDGLIDRHNFRVVPA